MLEDRIPRILESYSVIEEFRRDYGSYLRNDSGRSRAFCRCPFHDDRQPSLILDQDGFRCMSARCGVNGDIIDYVMLRDGCTKREAVDLLADGLNLTRPAQRVPVVREKFVAVEMSYIQRFYNNLPIALPFFQGRAVSARSGHRHKLGAWPDFYWNYTTLKGEVVRFECPRYSIPNIRTGFDRGGSPITVGLDVNFRRDDEAALRILKSRDRALMKRVGEDIATRWEVSPKDITWEAMLNDCFGPKYWRKGSATHMFNANAVVTPTPDGSYTPTRLSSVLLVEGEIDAMSLTEAGYAAVAIKYSRSIDLTRPLSNVAHIYIVKDHDQDRVEKDGRISNGGRDNALKLYEHLKESGRDNITIIETPVGFKDANDVITKGNPKTWLLNYGLIASSTRL